jgi:hypothetical protein
MELYVRYKGNSANDEPSLYTKIDMYEAGSVHVDIWQYSLF